MPEVQHSRFKYFAVIHQVEALVLEEVCTVPGTLCKTL